MPDLRPCSAARASGTSAGLLGLGDNPEPLLHPPATPPFNQVMISMLLMADLCNPFRSDFKISKAARTGKTAMAEDTIQPRRPCRNFWLLMLSQATLEEMDDLP